MTPSLLMEDHSSAYGFWKELGIREAVCVHVDAHLDVMDRGFTTDLLQKLRDCTARDGLEALTPPPYLPWGGLHCGNYLFPAMQEGIVAHLVWVVPEHLPGEKLLLDFAREELLNWVDLTIAEYQSLKMESKCVQGTLCGKPFTLCTAEHLPSIAADSVVLLDIDVDYFQDAEDAVWQTPSRLCDLLNLSRLDALTVAVSVDGGYTSLENRYLAEVTERVFLHGEAQLWADRVEAVLAADRERTINSDAYEALGRGTDPDWLKAALSLKSGLARRLTVQEASVAARELDHRFSVSDFNQALVEARHQRLETAFELLTADEEHLFMRAILALKGGSPQVSRDAWEEFMSRVDLGRVERAHALYLLGQACLQLEELDQAQRHLSQAATLDPESFQYQLFAGLAFQVSGDLKKAAKYWRKALADHPDRVSCVELHLELSRLYRDLDRVALAEAELRRLQQKDLSGQFKLLIQMEHIRADHSSNRKNNSSLWRAVINLVGVHS